MYKTGINSIICFLVCIVLLPSIHGQNNPFDLAYRLKNNDNPFDINKKEITTIDSSSELKVITPSIQNPFDIDQKKRKNKSLVTSQPKKSNHSSPPIIKKNPKQLLTWVSMGLLLLFTLLISLNSSTIKKTYQAFFNDNVLRILYREQRNGISITVLLFYFFFILNFSLFLFLNFNHFNILLPAPTGKILLYCILGSFLFIIGKHLILHLLRTIFPIKKEIDVYNFTIIIFGIITGILLFPANIIIAFTPNSISTIFIFILLGMLCLIYIFRAIRGLFIAIKYIQFYKFHFFMYLCVVEITPAVILLRLAFIQEGL